jgi:SAM-dependent methyltransferase
MTLEIEIDVGLLKSEIKKTYASVSQEPEKFRCRHRFARRRADGRRAGPRHRDRHTPEMLTKARAAAAEMGAANVEFVEGEAEQLTFPDASFDVVISNGVIDLIPDKDAVFAEISRVLRPGGRIQIADVTIQNPVSAEGRRNIDLWTG